MGLIDMGTGMVKQGDRRSFIRHAAGFGLAMPAMGLLPGMARAQDANSTPASDGGHGGHGGGSTGPAPEGFKLYDPALAPVQPGPKEITVTAMDAVLPVDSETMYNAWTFDGTIPGRMLRVIEGDEINFTFKVDPNALIGHSLDFHSAKVSPDEHYRTLLPGEELSYSFVPKYPGVYMYHCGTPPILMHIGAGMFGAMIVDPKEGWEPAQEFALVQSEYYLVDDGTGTGVKSPDYTKMMGNGIMDHVVFNGYANQYVDNPIAIRMNETVRLFVQNSGPNIWSSFHVVGTIFDRVYVNGNPKNVQYGLQSVTIGPGDGAVVEFQVEQPGMYPFVNHAFGHASHGCVGLFHAQ
jgi:nitrite reductase (NO-forming)